MAAAKKTVLAPFPANCVLLTLDTASKVGPDSYAMAAPTVATLSTKAAPWMANVASRTKSPPPDAEALEVAAHAVIVEAFRA
jgi:hypothetical protein